MKNIELQKILATLPPDLPVTTYDNEYGSFDNDITIAKVIEGIETTFRGYTKHLGDKGELEWDTYTEINRAEDWELHQSGKDNIISKRTFQVILVSDSE
jgi:hypothetical protein